jgi:hypothetical protein
MIPPPPVEYPFNHEVWGKTFNPNDKGNWKDDIVNTHIVQRMLRWKRQGYKDFDLWEDYQESFEEWIIELFSIATRDALKELRTYLTTHGVFVRK